MFGLFVCGTPLGSGCWWSPGERFAACSVCAACSVGALWPVACQGRDTPGGSAAPARPLQGRPPLVRHGCDAGRVGLLRLSPHGVGQSSSFTRRADGAPSGIRDLTRQVCHVFVLRQFDVAATVGGRLRRSDGFTLYASNRLAPDRGFGARPGVSDGVYGLLRPHDHGMPGVILDTGSEAFLLGERPPVHSPGWWLAAGISTFRAAGGMSMCG